MFFCDKKLGETNSLEEQKILYKKNTHLFPQKINLFLFPSHFILSPEFNQSSDCSIHFQELTTAPPPKKWSTC